MAENEPQAQPSLLLVILIGVALWYFTQGGAKPPAPEPEKPVPVVVDVLGQCHKADRMSQVRILREYAGQSFASDSAAQKWINEQRIAARTADWIPYTDELGKRALEGPEAVRKFADELEAVK